MVKHGQKRLAESTKKARQARWVNYVKPAWGDWPISSVTHSAAQEWVTEVEEKIASGESGSLGPAQFEKVRTDLHFIFSAARSFSTAYENRANPFAELEFKAIPPRSMATIESQHFAALVRVCDQLVAHGLCVDWVVEMFLTSLLSGLREGETLALCRDQIDFENGAIIVDRAMRRDSRAIDPKSRAEIGPILRQAVNLPKGGTARL